MKTRAPRARPVPAVSPRLTVPSAAAGREPRADGLRFRIAMETAGLGLWDWDVKTNIVEWEPMHNRILGLPIDKKVGSYQEFLRCLHPDEVARVDEILQTALRDKAVYEAEYRVVHPDGSVHWVTGRGYPLYNDDGKLERIIGVVRDITAQKQSDEKFRASLREKEILLKEIHHRVKNNLQVIVSLFNLQSGQIRNERARELFEETRNRVQSIATIHDLIFRSDSFAELDVVTYALQLAEHLAAFYSMEERVRVKVRGSAVKLSLEQAVPFGLLLNELVSNAYKHAYPGERKGQVQVSLASRPNGEILLTVADDGIGLPDHVANHRRGSLGLQLVEMLVTQLRGIFVLRSDSGTIAEVCFPAVNTPESEVDE